MNYQIKKITKQEAEPLLLRYHYLTDQTKTFRCSQHCYGAYHNESLIAVCIFTGFPVAELFKGIWGIKDFRSFDQSGFYELSRLCIHPQYQKEKCLASWFVSKCLRRLKNDKARAVLSYADDDHHSGVVYAACNFTYYGLSDAKYNIWVPCPEQHGGKYLPAEKRPGRIETHWKQMTRGWKEHLDNGGIKVLRGRKHRFLIVWDKTLPPVMWKQQKWTNNKAGLVIDTHPASTATLRSLEAREIQKTLC